MGISEHLVLIFVVFVMTLVLRYVQLQSFTRIEIYIFVFMPVLILAVCMLFFALIDFKRELFWNIGKLLFFYAAIGLVSGHLWSRFINK